MLKLVNLKDGEFNVELALATVEIEIEQAKKEGVVAIKVLHGYGSHGRGGIIAFELRKCFLFGKDKDLSQTTLAEINGICLMKIVKKFY